MNPADSFACAIGDRARDQIHLALAQVSTNSQQLLATQSSHFVWVDQPEIMLDAVEKMIDRTKSQ
jgi:hypothetical protein